MFFEKKYCLTQGFKLHAKIILIVLGKHLKALIALKVTSDENKGWFLSKGQIKGSLIIKASNQCRLAIKHQWNINN